MMDGLVTTLKKMTRRENDKSKIFQGKYSIMRYWHPDSGKKPEFIKTVGSLELAESHCDDPSTRNSEGETETWFYDGYVEAGSRSSQYTLW